MKQTLLFLALFCSLITLALPASAQNISASTTGVVIASPTVTEYRAGWATATFQITTNVSGSFSYEVRVLRSASADPRQLRGLLVFTSDTGGWIPVPTGTGIATAATIFLSRTTALSAATIQIRTPLDYTQETPGDYGISLEIFLVPL